MNNIFKEFIKKNNIKISDIYDDLRIYEESEINRIISNFKIEGKSKITTVSIADIVGYDYSWRGQQNNIFDNFSNFFGNDCEYQRRSLGMLDYSNDEIIEKLYPSFKKERIRVLELDSGKKVISGNGLHRYCLLRLYYMNELSKVKGNKEKEEELKSKYEIVAELRKVDLLKTYCNFLISKTLSYTEDISLSSDYDENYRLTGKVKISENGENQILNDIELIEYTRKRILSMDSIVKEYFKYAISTFYNCYESFRVFIDIYFSQELDFLFTNKEKNERGK